MTFRTTPRAFAAGLAVLASTSALADFDLQITEMWPGNEPGSNLTADWFEVTNFGDTAWTAATDGALFFDDDSQDPTVADLMSGVATLAPGESAVFIDDADTSEFETVWGALPGVQKGIYAGSGLGGGGDGVTLFLDAGSDGVTAGDIIDFESYPDADANGGQSWDVGLGAFSTVGNASGAFQSLVANDAGQFGVASPGAIPEPTSLAILGAAGLLLGTRRRRA